MNANTQTTAGNVAIQQALRIHFGLTYREVASIMKVNPRTVWAHVAAQPGAKVAKWDNRSEAQRQAAIAAAAKKIEEREAKNAS